MRASRAVAPPLPRVAVGGGAGPERACVGGGGRRWSQDREAGRIRSGAASTLRGRGVAWGRTRPSDQARASPNPARDAGVGARTAVSPAAGLQGGFPREPDPPRVSGLASPGAARRPGPCWRRDMRAHPRACRRAGCVPAVPLSSGQSGAGTQPRPPAEEGSRCEEHTCGGGGEVVNIYFCVLGGWKRGTSAPEKGFLCSMTEFCR